MGFVGAIVEVIIVYGLVIVPIIFMAPVLKNECVSVNKFELLFDPEIEK